MRRCNAAIPCTAHRTATGIARNAARPCRPCLRPLYRRHQRTLRPFHLFSSLCCQGLVRRKSWIPHRRLLRPIGTHRLSPKQRHPCLFAFNQPSSRLAASRAGVPRHITFCWKEKIMGFRNARGRGRPRALGLVLLSVFASTAGAQGPAPETAPPLFPGGDLISYNSVFTTPGPISSLSAYIPFTTRPTFSREGDFNFTWAFHRDFDLTVLVPVVTSHFEMPSGNPQSGGTGLGGWMVSLKNRLYPRWSKRGAPHTSPTVDPPLAPPPQHLPHINTNKTL